MLQQFSKISSRLLDAASGERRSEVSGSVRQHRARGLSVAAVVGVLVASAAFPARAVVIERIVAVVNNEIILLSELQQRAAPFMAQLANVTDPQLKKKRQRELYRQMLDQMINDLFIAQEAKKLKLTVEDAEVERAVEEVMHRNNLSREQLEQALLQEGKSLQAYKQLILRPQLLRLKVLNVQVRSRISVSDAEVQALYEQNLRSLGVESKVHARSILVAVPDGASATTIAERRAFAADIAGRLRQGAAFAELARHYSDDAASREQGGDLGFFSHGVLPPNVEDTLHTMHKDEIRGPLQAAHGFYIVQLIERQASSARSLDEVRDQLREQLYAQKMEKATQVWLKEVRRRSYLDIKL